MHRYMRAILAWAAAGLMCAGMAARAASDALTMIPKTAEVVIGVNARQIVDSEVFKRLLTAHPELKSRMEILQTLMGIDLLKDVNRLWFFGRINNRQEGGFIFQGRYDPRKVLTLLKANPQYTSRTVNGQTYHVWFDAREGRMKVGALFPNGLTAVWNSEEAVQASEQARLNPAESYAATPDARLIPGSDVKSAAWVVVVNKSGVGPLARFRLASAMANAALGPGEVVLHLTAVPQAAEDSPRWADLFRGMVAFGLLQNAQPPLQYVAGRTQVAPSPDGKAVTVTTSVEMEKIMQVIEKTRPAEK